MSRAQIPTGALKEAVKEALVDALREERDLLRDVLVEAFEEIGLAEAIDQGRQTELVDRGEIFDILKGAA